MRLSALGDVVTGLHVLSTIRARMGSAHIGWLVGGASAPLLEGHPQIDVIHAYVRPPLRSAWRCMRAVRAERYDLVLDLQGNLKSGFLARLSGAKRCMGVGGSLSRELNHWLVRELVDPVPGNRVESYWALVDTALGAGPHEYGTLPTEPDNHRGIVLHPGVSSFGAIKKWPVDRFAALGDRLHDELGAPVLVTAGPGEREEAEGVCKAMRRDSRLVEPPSLRALTNTLAGARIVIAGDTGPAHIAAATGVPTLSLFGPTDPGFTSAYGETARTVSAGVRCSPCMLRRCPDVWCMRELDVDLVARRALELVEALA